MKTNFILLFMLLANSVVAQYPNLDKLPQKERDSLLVKIANAAIEKFSTGYLRPGNKPRIEDLGIENLSEQRREDYKRWGMEEYLDRYRYAVYYAPTEKEKAFYKRWYLVRVIILANTGKVYEISYIDQSVRRYCLDRLSPEEESRIIKRKFKTVEERLIEIEKHKTKRRYLDPTPEMLEFDREIRERQQRRRDSGRILRKQYLRRRDSIRKQDSIRQIQRQDSIKNVQTENK